MSEVQTGTECIWDLGKGDILNYKLPDMRIPACTMSPFSPVPVYLDYHAKEVFREAAPKTP
jgi:hypothetical protein